MKLKTLLITALATCATATSNAGESKEVVVEEVAAASTWSGALSAGYDNRYIFRGLWFGNDSVWTDLSVSKEIAPDLTFTVGAFYLDIADNSLAYSEANFYANVAKETSVGTFTLGALYYSFLDGFAGDNLASGPGAQSDAFELNLTYSRELFYGVNLSVLAAYDFKIDAQYFEAGLDKTWKLCDTFSLDASVAVGYGLNDYYSTALSGDASDDFTHVLVSLGLPIQLADTVVLRPHVSANFSGDARTRGNAASIGDEEVFYGISLAVSF